MCFDYVLIAEDGAMQRALAEASTTECDEGSYPAERISRALGFFLGKAINSIRTYHMRYTAVWWMCSYAFCFFLQNHVAVEKRRKVHKTKNTKSDGQNRVHLKARGQNRVPPPTLVPGRRLIGQLLPRPDSGRISNGSTRFWLLTPPSATRFQIHLPTRLWPDYLYALHTTYF